ncbi:MAG: Asp-tRNA(Asn)/Glu-tRNA(Gln) amidotransferase subunit GatA [Bacillota bacterium]|nr:Asp-tRNA(Asn)/Glu-tRNA(Gln) amidotransferase subunit GatA [Bacillota bacterium]
MKGKIVRLHEKLINGEITSLELTSKYLENIRKFDSEINSYITVTQEEAFKAAKATDEKIAKGEKVPLLSGIPMSFKDNLSTKGILTTCASKILSNYIPVYDAFVVEKLYEQGAVLLGKNNMDEFSMGSSCETGYYGRTKNPYNYERVTGGSSGGGAAAVATDMAVYSLGSDSGGSVRQPASFCGVVGLKPTYGAVSRNGMIAFASSFDQIGVLATTVEDTAIVFDTISAYDAIDATCSGKKRDKCFEDINRDIKGVKIGIIKNLTRELSGEISKSIKDSCESLKSLGADITELRIDNLDLAMPVYCILTCAEASSNLARYDGVRYGYRTKDYESIDEMIRKTRSEGFGSEVKQRIMMGNYVLGAGRYENYYKKAMSIRQLIKKSVDEAFEKVDVLLSPTSIVTAFKEEEKLKDPIDMYLSDLCTVTANICGYPALSVPCGFDNSGLPVGLQLMGRNFSEKLLLNVAYKFEDANQIIYKKPKGGAYSFEI